MKPIILKYKFKDFREALNFVNNVWKISEEINHHPNIKIQNYNEVILEIYTHSSNTITQKDLELKEKICDLKW
jgi:4a-hydroxytetrahydrobiopterin dehydratase